MLGALIEKPAGIMTVLTIVRHAQASFGSADYDRLSPLGERQAAHLGAWFKRIGYRPDKVVTGGLKRHEQTAEICLKAMNLTCDPVSDEAFCEFNHREVIDRHAPRFREHFLRSDLRNMTEFHLTFQAAVARWTGGAHDSEYGLSWPAFRKQVSHGLKTLMGSENEHVLLVSSGGPIGVMTQMAARSDALEAMRLCNRLYNSSVTRLRNGNLHSFNSVAHLEQQQDITLLTYI